MNIGSTGRKLESFRIFPYIAWGLIVVFAYIAYHITTELEAVTKDLDERTTSLEQQVKRGSIDEVDATVKKAP
ncbi:MAG: hypothetical protein RLZZ480_407 [Candidatus Parcubacteria bacterium]|jgi:hypothetical protein